MALKDFETPCTSTNKSTFSTIFPAVENANTCSEEELASESKRYQSIYFPCNISLREQTMTLTKSILANTKLHKKQLPITSYTIIKIRESRRYWHTKIFVCSSCVIWEQNMKKLFSQLGPSQFWKIEIFFLYNLQVFYDSFFRHFYDHIWLDQNWMTKH